MPWPTGITVGDVIGPWTVLSREGTRKYKSGAAPSLWKVRCNSCSQEYLRTGPDIRGKSAGCIGCRSKHRPTTYRSHTLEYQGQHFTSLSALARHLQISRGTLESRMRREGLALYAAVTKKKHTTSRFVTYKGERTTIVALCRRLNLDPVLVNVRIRKSGWSLNKALTSPRVKRPQRVVEFGGVRGTVAELSRELGVDRGKVNARLRAGWSADEAFKGKC